MDSRRHARTLLIAILGLSALACATDARAPATPPPVPVPPPEDGLDMDRVLMLRARGAMHFDASADVELTTAQRNAHRKSSWVLLTEAYGILDAWCDVHPDEIETLESLIVEIHQMRYWLRKESPPGLLEEGKRKPTETPPDWPDSR